MQLLVTIWVLCILYSRGSKPHKIRPEAPYLLRCDIRIIYCMMNAQEVNLLPETLHETTQFFPKVYITLHLTTSQCLSSYCCAITV